jgi:hypothetical protein
MHFLSQEMGSCSFSIVTPIELMAPAGMGAEKATERPAIMAGRSLKDIVMISYREEMPPL